MGTLSAGTLLEKGRHWPLGAHREGNGVNFALFSAHAEQVVLCLFADGEEMELPLPGHTDDVWHGFLPEAPADLCYAFRVFGPDGPGHRFDPDRLLLDPYARELTSVFSYRQSSPDGLKARVVDEPFDWQNDAPPAIPWADSVLYEVHVKGATRRHPGIPKGLRGTYAGLASPAMLTHFKKLGVTAVNLLPVHFFLDEERLIESGLSNYWGYNTLAFFAPEPRYAARIGGQSAIAEFRTMVRTLHASGIEVILDVVFNHTAETDETGPTVAFRGIDNRSYYRIPADAPERYENFSGCGNTLNLAHPRVLQLVMDSLRYWVQEMHVDGFRFDLAAALTRDSGFLAAIRQDPVLARVKLIAEPWDLGPDGYRLGRFPIGWGEWNDRFRDDVRGFWLTGESPPATLARRFAGSSEIFATSGRGPLASINFITAHDGFTLHDLVTYQQKHNELNGESNRDGHNHNLSCNCGIEGETSNVAIQQRRERLKRALLATLLTALGVPMLQGGDEFGRTQAGNNNAYCQDNPLTWFNWPHADEALIGFTAGLVALRQRFPQLRRDRWLIGKQSDGNGYDVLWWHPDGREMTTDDWKSTHGDVLGVVLPASESSGKTLLLVFNRGEEKTCFTLPQGGWQQLCDTSAETPFANSRHTGRISLNATCVSIFSQE